MKKYPDAFDAVYESAVLYSVFGAETQKKDLLLRALELLEKALVLIPQNTDPEISEQTIYGSRRSAALTKSWRKRVASTPCTVAQQAENAWGREHATAIGNGCSTRNGSQRLPRNGQQLMSIRCGLLRAMI